MSSDSGALVNTIEKDLPALPAVLGPLPIDLASNAVNFSFAWSIPATTTTVVTLDLFAHDVLKRLSSGRASARIVGPLKLSLLPVVAANATLMFCSGVVAMYPQGMTAPASMDQVLSIGGCVAMTVGFTGTLSTGSLAWTPNTRRDLVVKSQGVKPMLYAAFSSVGLTTVKVQVSGEMALEGLHVIPTF
jgi:hypothetical protein